MKYLFMSKKHKKANAKRLWINGWSKNGICKKLHVRKKTLDSWIIGF